jgi:hypothetical protein
MNLDATDVVEYRPGLRSYTTPRGIRVVEIDYWVNPSHDTAWANKQRPLYHSTKDWRREMERDWSSPAGDPYFPIFTQLGAERYVFLQTQFVEQWPVFRAFDFGRRRPACVWFQYSPKQDRIIGYREFMPHNIGTHDFRDAVKYLSNQLNRSQLTPEAERWVDEYAARSSGAHCPPPWFPLGTKFLDIGGKEALQQQSNAPKPEDAVASDIFAAGGLNLIIVTPRILGRNHIIDRMLSVKPDGFPGILIDPQMEESIAGFEGAWCYPEPTKAIPVPTKPKDDGHYINLLDAWGYGVAAVVPEETPKGPVLRQETAFVGGRPQLYTTPVGEEPNLYETRRRLR